MPLLESNNQVTPVAPTFSTEQITQRGEQEARRILEMPRNILETIVNEWSNGFDSLWAETHVGIVEARLAAIGTKGQELMDRNTALVTFLLTQLTGEDQDMIDTITAKISTIPAYTIADDGTVTLDQ